MKLAGIAAIVLAFSGASFAEKAPATTQASAVKVENTKCIVTGEDMMEKGSTVTYKGKEYNLCCAGCKADFNKDPEKFVQSLEQDPAKYGLKKDDKPAK